MTAPGVTSTHEPHPARPDRRARGTGADPRWDRRVGQNVTVNGHKFLNQSQPQTLVIATLFLYLDAVFGLFGLLGALGPLGLITIVGLAAGGFGIANEWKWAYSVAVAAAIVQVVFLVAIFGLNVIDFPVILSLLFDGALVALLLHPESRNYQRIWFK
jgi:hypothetical protein